MQINSNLPLISIIIPVYNVESYIDVCLKSVKEQTYKNLEVLIIDDGSTDRSGEICRSYADGDERFRYFHKENGGVSSARNLGLDNATGDYVGFVDGDDEILPDMYESLLAIIESAESDVAISSLILNRSGKIISYKDSSEIHIFDRKDGVKELLLGNLYMGHLCNKLFKRRLFDEVRLPCDITISEDLIAVLEAMLSADRVAFCDTHKYIYKMNNNSAFYGGWRDSYLTYITAAERVINTVEENLPELSSCARTVLLQAYIDVVSKLYYSKRLDKDTYSAYRTAVKSAASKDALILMPLYKRIIIKSMKMPKFFYSITINAFNVMKRIIFSLSSA